MLRGVSMRSIVVGKVSWLEIWCEILIAVDGLLLFSRIAPPLWRRQV